MQYAEFAPCHELVPYVHCVWTLNDAAVAERPAERIVPDGRMEIVFNLGDAFTGVSGARREVRPSAIIVGEIRRAVTVHPARTINLLGIRFRSAGLAPVLGLPASELADAVITLDSLWGSRVAELEMRLREAPSREQARALLERELVGRLRANKRPVDPLTQAFVADVERAGGHVRIAQLARSAGISERQLERRIRAGVGIGPKAFSRVVRFRRVFHAVAECAGTATGQWAQIALNCGYYDQAHLIADFRSFCDTSPEVYFEDHHTLADCFMGIADA